MASSSVQTESPAFVHMSTRTSLPRRTTGLAASIHHSSSASASSMTNPPSKSRVETSLTPESYLELLCRSLDAAESLAWPEVSQAGLGPLE